MILFQEFKKFIMRGNVIDLAVGVVVGAAFGKIVSSMVDDIIMPPIGKLLGNMDFSNFYLPLSEKVPAGLALVEARKLGPVIAWGNFLTVLLNFMIIAFCIFLLIKAINRLHRKQEAAPPVPPAPSAETKLLAEIRDLLKARN